MATSNGDSMTVKRCPVCLARHQNFPGLMEVEQVKCTICGQSSKWGAWLDGYVQAQTLSTDRSGSIPTAGTPSGGKGTWITWLVVFLLGIIWFASFLYMVDLDGPAFLDFYLNVFLATFIGSTALRLLLDDKWRCSLVGFAAFEGVGVIRLLTGLNAGMHRFGFMIAMMVGCGFIFFMRAKENGRGYGIGGSCAVGGCGGEGGCSSGGGCGGGGGGCGGGCGGCGGD